MKSMMRAVLVDPDHATRSVLQEQLGAVGLVWLGEVCGSYAEAGKLASTGGADLFVVVLDSDIEQALNTLREIHKHNPKAALLPASRSRDGETILKALRAGAREFLPLPTNGIELATILERLTPQCEGGESNGRIRSRTIAVTGAAGGVGCTTLAVNLAAALAKIPGHSVALTDFDLLLGSVDTALDVIAEHTLLDIALDIQRLDLTLLKRALTRHSSGVYVLPNPSALEDAAKIDPEALRHVVGLLQQEFSHLVIDTSKGFQATDFVAFEMADTILLVVQPELGCLRNSARLLQLFRQLDGMVERIQIVANQVGSSAHEISIKKAEETLGMKIAWQIPYAGPIVSAARSKGVPLETQAPNSRPHRAILEIAGQFGPLPSKQSSKPAFGRLTAFFS